MLDTVRGILLTGKPSDHFSRYVPVMLYIGAGIRIVNALIFCFWGYNYFIRLFTLPFTLLVPPFSSVSRDVFVTLTSGLCSGSVSILFGIIIFTLRSRMRKLMGQSGGEEPRPPKMPFWHRLGITLAVTLLTTSFLIFVYFFIHSYLY